MTAQQLTKTPTEADLEAEIHGVIRKAFPWLPAEAIRHQTKFSFTFGHATIEVDGVKDLQAEGRTDILVRWNEIPLAILELKRKGVVLTSSDVDQGLSYASVIRPRFPLVVVSNGDETRIFESYSGNLWQPATSSEAEFSELVAATAQAATTDVKNAVSTLMGSRSTVWMQAIRAASEGAIEELTGRWDEPMQPFVRNYLFPRKASAITEAELTQGRQFVLIEGAPLVGKSSLMREMVHRTVTSPDFAVLFLVADEGAGIFQAIADILSTSLSWPVTADEARTWLRSVSRANGPSLVLAVDGVGPEHVRLRRELEDLSSSVFGSQLRLLVTVDDAVTTTLIEHPRGRQASTLGRRIDGRIELAPLDDDEFELAAQTLWEHRMAIMHGGHSSAELRVPWILRALGGRYAPEPGEQPDKAAVLPSQLSLGLIAHARERFNDEDLRRQFREIAKAVLQDTEEKDRPIALLLESMATFVVRRRTLLQFLALSEIESLLRMGYLKPSLHASGEAVLFVRLPELLASEASIVLASGLVERGRADPAKTALEMVSVTSRLPLGDIVAAHAFVDAIQGSTGVPLDVVAELVRMAPKRTPIKPGMRAAMHVPGVGMMEMTFQADGSFVGELKGQSHTFAADPGEGLGELIEESHAWLILSHLAGQRIGIARGSGTERIDLALLGEVGRCPHALRRPDSIVEGRGVLTHSIAGYGEVVCHKAGIVEPITFSLFRRVSEEGPDIEDWIRGVVSDGSLAMLARLDIALRETAKLADDIRRPWAERMLAELVTPALNDALQCTSE
jgi:hypothetical protein